MSNFDEKIIERLKRLEREVERLRVKERPAGGGGVTDHGQLTGLGDDDHAQYLLITGNKSQTIAGQKGFSSVPTIPHLGVTANNHVTSKYYVDQAILAAATPTYEWFDWTPSQYTGWSSLPTGSYRYCVIGKTVLGVIDMTAGTSNATSARISLPPVSKRTGVTYGGVNAYAVNNGTVLTVATRWEIGSTLFDSTINFFSNMGTGAWNASGTKRIRCNFMYELA